MPKLTAKQKLELGTRYNEYINDQAGMLNNKIIALVSESKIPLIQVMLVLELLLENCKRQCFQKYLGK